MEAEKSPVPKVLVEESLCSRSTGSKASKAVTEIPPSAEVSVWRALRQGDQALLASAGSREQRLVSITADLPETSM